MTSLSDLFARVDDAYDEIIGLEQALVRIPTVNTGFMPTGDETKVCRFVSDKLASEGIEGEILESAPGRGNYFARLKGRGQGPTLLYMAHTDVVPVEMEDEWICPPFSAEIIDGRIYGRGSSDCKGLLTCQMMAMIILKRAGVPLQGDLALAACADEEAGGKYGVGWLVENHPQRLKADFCINEGGGDVVQRKGAPAYLFGIGEKGRLEVYITVKGVPCHASTPWNGVNALTRASEVLKRLDEYKPEIDVSLEIFGHLKSLGIDEDPTPENIDLIAEELAQRDAQMASRLRGLSRMTVSATMIEGGIKSNSIPSSCRITCDVRTLPHQSEGYLREQLDEILKDIPGVSYEIDYMAVPNSSDFDTDLSRSIKDSTAKALGRADIQWVPAISTGFTDSRFTRPLGTVTYGFSGSHPDDDPMLSHVHGTDESVGIPSLISGTKIMMALAIDLLT